MTSRLVVGNRRFKSKPPRKGPPCTEPLIRGANILRDPGFELHLANIPGGPNGEVMPGDGLGTGGTNPGSLYWNTVNITDLLYYDVNGWAVFSNNIGSFGGTPQIATANPRSGTYHWRVTHTAFNEDSTEPVVVGGRFCEQISGRIHGYSGRVEPGDFVRFGAWIMASTTTGTPVTQFDLSFYTSAAALISSVTGSQAALTTAYAYHELTAFAPATAYAFVVTPQLFTTTSQSADISYDVDDCVLEVT